MQQQDWDAGAKCFGMLMDGRSQAQGLRERGTDATLLMVFNSRHDSTAFTLPPCNGAGAWALLIDTVATELAAARTLQIGEHYQLCARSLLLFELLPEAT
jgi:glycogen operon protein